MVDIGSFSSELGLKTSWTHTNLVPSSIHGYDPKAHICPELWEVMNLIKCGHFSQGDKDTFEPLVSNLMYHDPFCVFADFSSYLDAQDRVSSAWKNRDSWNRMSLLNIASSGFFSSDRSIRDYCTRIWGIPH